MPQILSHNEKNFRRKLKSFLERHRPGSTVSYLPTEDGRWTYQVEPPELAPGRDLPRGYGGRFIRRADVNIVDKIKEEEEEECKKG